MLHSKAKRNTAGGVCESQKVEQPVKDVVRASSNSMDNGLCPGAVPKYPLPSNRLLDIWYRRGAPSRRGNGRPLIRSVPQDGG